MTEDIPSQRESIHENGLKIFQKLNETYPGQDVCFFKQDETLFWFGIRRLKKNLKKKKSFFINR